ncbi:MAG TPA: tRNA glutamyl-Q(34) synthetase GluQRS [Planctomycetota bacterium]
MTLRGRLAPSPTGVLHLGNARSFLLAWLDVRARGGEVLLRIEDLDGPRIKSGAAEAAIEDLAWLGLDWDAGPVYQRPRLACYRAALEKLAAAGLAYPCTCTRRDVELAASAPHAGEEGPLYPGTCRGRFADAAAARAASGAEPCWRFAVPAGAAVEFADRHAGPQRIAVGRELGDFVIWKKDGEPAYQLAVVVDDAEQGVNSILRGADLLPSAARQTLLYQALGHAPPEFAHVPLVVGSDGRRLAKRHGDTTLSQFRAAGYDAPALLRWLAEVSGLAPPRRAYGCARDLLADFALARVPAAPVVWRGAL